MNQSICWRGWLGRQISGWRTPALVGGNREAGGDLFGNTAEYRGNHHSAVVAVLRFVQGDRDDYLWCVGGEEADYRRIVAATQVALRIGFLRCAGFQGDCVTIHGGKNTCASGPNNRFHGLLYL
jgi:hypothetical protein